MKTYQNIYREGAWQEPLASSDAQLVLLFGDRDLASDAGLQAQLRDCFPAAEVVGCTTSGEIQGVELYDNSLCLSAVSFQHSHVQVRSIQLSDYVGLREAANSLVGQLEPQDLKHVLVFSDGQKVNGTELIAGLEEKLPPAVSISGGLAGDGTRFSETVVWHNDTAASGQIVVVGFYGDKLALGHGSIGGWDPFGPQRRVTRSEANVLYTLDDKPALELYKTYLGDHAHDLPASALLFPLLIRNQGEESYVIRTILNIDEANNSMIFAGDIPEGSSAQLMRANFDRIIDGAESAAANAAALSKSKGESGLAILISCVGRRLVLNQRTEEELESVRDVLGDNFAYTGFYSYGEISPLVGSNSCALHNQTMTVTTIFERDA